MDRKYAQGEECEVPVELAAWLRRFQDASKVIDTGLDFINRGCQVLDDVQRTPHIPEQVMPEPLRAVLVGALAALHIQVHKKTGFLKPRDWVTIESDIERSPYLYWTRTRVPHPVFIGRLAIIDYTDPLLTRWVYDEKQQTRAAHHKGIHFLFRTTTQIEAEFTREPILPHKIRRF